MKTFRKFQLITLLIGLITFSSCVENNDFDIPKTEIIAFTPNSGDIVTNISSVIGELAQQGQIFTYEPLSNPTNSRYMEGYVISSDESGNFFEQLVLQDQPENPTAGIAVQVDVNPLYIYYEFGRKVFIKLDGLSVAEENGVIKIGKRDGNSIEKISSPLRNQYIIRDSEIATIIPLELNVTDFSNSKENLFIRLVDAQFYRSEVFGDRILTFAGESTDEFNGERIIETCPENNQVILSTSTFSDFKSLPLSINRGSIDAVLTRNFFDNFYTLIINSPEDIQFIHDQRCDPIVLDCGLADNEGKTIVFQDDFETQTRGSLIIGNGWTNFIEKGSKGFEAYTASGSNASLGVSARIGSFNSGDDSNIAWLITPVIDLDTNSSSTLSFQTSNSFADGSKLEVLFSNNWDGNTNSVTDASWGLLTAGYIIKDSDSFSSWPDSGIVDLSCSSGKMYIAFRYKGNSSSNFDGTYELDNIKIRSN